MVQRTLSIVKPDAVANNAIGGVLAVIEKGGLKIIASKMIHMTRAQAERFYAVHKERPFYDDLTKFMSEGPVVVSVLEGAHAIERYRELLGATNPEKADPGTIRKKFATDIEKNAVHGSDAPETAKIEIAYFFAETELVRR